MTSRPERPLCAYCTRPDPRDDRRFQVIDGHGSNEACGMCALQILASPHVQVTLMLDAAPVSA